MVTRGWWTPLLLTAGVASAKYFLRHISRKNSVTQTRQNISQHYDLVSSTSASHYALGSHLCLQQLSNNFVIDNAFHNQCKLILFLSVSLTFVFSFVLIPFLLMFMQSNEFFSLFLDPSMTYSCAIFKVCLVINQLVPLIINFVMHLVNLLLQCREMLMLDIVCGPGRRRMKAQRQPSYVKLAS